LHNHGSSNSSRFTSTNPTAAHSNSIQPMSNGQLNLNLNLNLNQKLKSTATRENLTNSDRRPMLTAITKPRFNSNRFEESSNNGNATEPTLGSFPVGTQNQTSFKNLTLNHNSDKKFDNSERNQTEKAVTDLTPMGTAEGFNSQSGEGRSQSRTATQQLPHPTLIGSTTNGSHHLQLSGSQQRSNVLKQSKSNITSKTIGLMQ